MNIYERAQRDILQITTDRNGAGEKIFLVWPDASELELTGVTSKHHFAVDTDGNQVNSKTAHVAISEKQIITAGKTIRNVSGEVDLTKHKLRVKDSTGVEKQYYIRSNFPDETVGLIVCILNKLD